MRPTQPLHVARLCALLLALNVCLPAGAAAQTKQADPKPAAKKTTTTAKTPAKTPAKKPAYSAAKANARKAQLARARAAAKAREAAAFRQLQEAMTPRFKTDATGALVPDIRAAAAIIFNPETGQVLWEENGQMKRSIASITKVMTAIVFLEEDPDLSRQVTIERSDVFAASTTFLHANERISLENLLHLTLISSDNAAARALARVSRGGTAAFIERMNEKAVELGLESTAFADSSGLNPANVSSAYDVSRLISFASADDRIAPIMRTREHRVSTNRRSFSIRSTNRLLGGDDVDVMGGKTGFISKAGHCLATLLRLPQGYPVAVVVLGASDNNGRFWETRHLFNWISARANDIFAQE